ncbi:uncharacterized protein EI97DRAFT_217495 [Westerdykella ornata]|uniref:Conidiation-specific expression protein n=1 Tax=Westerdykella ornata TaxID=318751 RepID=A0A6A6JR58_WESOR|nr:uncharacterized protein EI97DRAFT_217495 [Westerdykella ornata]KAF2278734.1 hypothetical protein EI97DRAFT_217495 [Westerdykella ornata]
MPTPFFHQKYATQTHKIFETHHTPPQTKDDRRPSDANDLSRTSSASSDMSSPPPQSHDDSPQKSPWHDRRRSSASNRLENFVRPQDAEHTARRASMQDFYAKPGFFGKMWNNWTHGPTTPGTTAPGSKSGASNKEPRDITTLRSE